MEIGIASLAVSSVLALGTPFAFTCKNSQLTDVHDAAIRQILIRDNRRLDESELDDVKAANRERIEEAARLEGITYEEALERKKGFRYLY